ncbi:MAG: hypothetical protein QHI38_04385 [Armatimonadota bacterium]|nr:hypothetical protein [Armatimonadota bacterium]
MSRWSAACALCAFFSLLLHPARASVWLSENFDAYIEGNLVGQGDWTGVPGPVRVQSTFAKSGKAAQGDYLSWGTGDAVLPVNSGSGTHIVEFDAAADTNGSAPVGTNLGYVKFFNEKGEELTRFYFAHRQFKILLYPATQYVIVDNTANLRWYHIRIGIDLLSAMLDVWVDGAHIVQGRLYKTGTSINTIAVGQWNQGTLFTRSNTYIDNMHGEAVQTYTASLVLSPMVPWTCWEAYNVLYPFVIYDEPLGRYRMFYTGSAAAQSNESVWDLWQIGIAESTDGVNWTRRQDDYEPVLYSTQFPEGAVLNPEELSQVFDSVWAFGACVIRDANSYRMWYTGWNSDVEYLPTGKSNKINFRIGHAVSIDGIKWTKVPGEAGAGSVLGVGQPNSPDCKGAAQPFVIKIGDTYRMWYEGYDGQTWRILCASSSDGIHWQKQGVAIDTGPAGSLDELGARNPVVIRRKGGYELWYQGQSASPPFYHVLRATSADCTVWTKQPGEVELHPYPPAGSDLNWNAYDPTAQVHVDSVIVNEDGTCRVFFAKQLTASQQMRYGSVEQRRFYIYTEVVNP